MLLAFIRVAFVLATVIASLEVSAAVRFWMLDGTAFDDGSHASGYIGYDDATHSVSTWNLHVDYFPFVFVPPFTYVPGNSVASVVQSAGSPAPTLVFSAAIGAADINGWPGFSLREARVAALGALDGSNATVAIDTVSSAEAIPSLARTRRIRAGALVLMPLPPAIALVQVEEFYNMALGHYFMTADAAEKQDLDSGVHPGWQRTGESFKAYAAGSPTAGSIDPVCRYYSPPVVEFETGTAPGSNSHFFSADARECVDVFRRYSDFWWVLESDNTFQVALPDRVTGGCPAGTIPVYRLWNQRADSNHRYTTKPAIRAQMVAAGFVPEGYGADGVAMCAVP